MKSTKRSSQWRRCPDYLPNAVWRIITAPAATWSVVYLQNELSCTLLASLEFRAETQNLMCRIPEEELSVSSIIGSREVLHVVKTGSGAHPASYPVGTEGKAAVA
jgi:hypothetical protein